MTDQTAGAHLPATPAGAWSLSSKDKKRVKRTFALSAAIILLLWLLYQLAQYTIALGAEPQMNIHIDGDWKKTTHIDSGRPSLPFLGGIDGEQELGDKPWTPPPAERGFAGAPDGNGNEASPPSDDGDQSNFSTSGGIADGTNPGAGAGNPASFGFGNIPLPWTGPGGSFPGGGGPTDNGKGDDPGGNGVGDPDGKSPGDGPGLTPSFEIPPQPGTGDDPSGGGGGSPDIPPPDSPPAPDGQNIIPTTVQVPEPASLALFGVGLLALLGALRMRSGLRTASEKSAEADMGPGSIARLATGLHRRRRCLAAAVGIVLLGLVANPASAETATVYGTTATIFSANYGAFLPANTELACFSMSEANCWDGKKWHQLYPSGHRHYAIATADRVACSVIVAPSNDCWTGSNWYRLPRGQIFGVIAGYFSNTPGAFITAPLRPKRTTIISAPMQSPLGEFASKR